MTKVGVFKIETSFDITGRGIVAVGQIIEGIPLIGNYLSVTILDNKDIIKIIGTERGKHTDDGIARFGILLSIADPERKKFIAENKLQNQFADIYKD